MKRKKIIIPVVLVIGLCLLLFWKSGEFYGQKVSIPNPEAISQVQLRTAKISREDYPSEKLDNLLKSIEDAVPVESGKNKRLERNDEFTSVLLIYEDGTKEKFFFFENDGKWYMETEQGILYENAEFIKDYAVPQKTQESGPAVLTVNPEILEIYLTLLKENEISSRFYRARELEFMEGNDTVNGQVCGDIREYCQMFLQENVYGK